MKDKQVSEAHGKKFPPNSRPLAIETVTKVVASSHPSRSNEVNQITVSLPRVPGMDTVTRLAWRIRCGRTPEEAAVREYVYRWHLANRSMSFGAPHIIGM